MKLIYKSVDKVFKKKRKNKKSERRGSAGTTQGNTKLMSSGDGG